MQTIGAELNKKTGLLIQSRPGVSVSGDYPVGGGRKTKPPGPVMFGVTPAKAAGSRPGEMAPFWYRIWSAVSGWSAPGMPRMFLMSDGEVEPGTSGAVWITWLLACAFTA